MSADLEKSAFQNKPAYRYVRAADRLPSIDAAREESPAMARIKLFDPTGSWTWYLNSYDPGTRQAYGLVVGFEAEYGYMDLAELCELRGRFGLPIERDLHWTPRPMADILAKLEAAS